MIDPWTSDGIWLRCALHAHTTRSDGELAPPGISPATTQRAGYDVLAITDHWRITGDDSVDAAPRRPQRRAQLRPARRPRRSRPRFRRLGSRRRIFTRWRRSTRTSPGQRAGSRPRRHRVPRPPVLDGRRSGNAGAPGERRRDRGLQRGLRARGRAAACPRCTGTSCSRRAGCAPRSQLTTPTIPGTTRILPGRG